MADNEQNNVKISNFFTNEDPKKATNTSGYYGVVPDEISTTDIIDGVTERGKRLGKIGSSIPSPLARLFLFSTALEEVNGIQAEDPQNGHDGVLNSEDKYEPTPYHDLVGELLDVLEFVFKYGSDPDFHVELWDKDTECMALDASNVAAHQQLAAALRSAFDYGVLKNYPAIYILKWGPEKKKQDQLVIGGTSPVSLVYSSANLQSAIDIIGRNYFTGDAGNILFSGKPTPLYKRDETFRKYLYNLKFELPDRNDTSNPLSLLTAYIEDSGTIYDNYIYNSVIVASDYGNVKDLQTKDGNPVIVAGVQLKVSDRTVVINKDTSHYLLAPTRDHYDPDKPGGSDVKLPMILTKQGNDKLIYAQGRKWNPNSDKIPAVLPENISDRYLPGFGVQVKYPFLTASDFFEDKVIEVSYEINEKFFTGSKKQVTFLLPLKKVFFEYFKVSDLYKADGTYSDMLIVQHDEERETLTVTLNLPLKKEGQTITLRKVYDTSADSSEKVDCYDGSHSFDVAFFPFYRMEPDTSRNVYSVMLGRTIPKTPGSDVSMKFFELSPTGKDGFVEVAAKCRLRTERSDNSILETDHIRVNGPFSFAELSVLQDGREYKALIIPNFKKASSNAIKHFNFSIDFGTTNTHVAYAIASPGTAIGLGNIHPFSYSDNDSQMVALNNAEGPRSFGAFTTVLQQEFVPATLGDEDGVKFPMRTVTYQVAGFPPTLEMFFNTNIGFNYEEDISYYSNTDIHSGNDNSDSPISMNYKTNIKWDHFDDSSRERMKTYFTQMLWMMKNKSVLNGGSNKFTLVVTYPISMHVNDLAQFMKAWNEAIKDVKCSVDIHYCTESVAPYYSNLPTLNYRKPYANMDIGGGTTDILYVNPSTKETSVFSAYFAANDLWNDGVDKTNLSAKANGFLTLYIAQQSGKLGNREAAFNAVLRSASSSADVISYLFTNDDWSKLTTMIEGSKLMQLPIVHFAALLFFMAYTLDKADLDVPSKLSFTGMGSKYIRLLGTDESISKFVNAVLRYAGKPEVLDNLGLRNAAVSVEFVDNPKEVTAKGALASMNYGKPIAPSEDIFFGYEKEIPGKTMRYEHITEDVQNGVISLFTKFTGLFRDADFRDVVSDLRCNVDKDLADRLNDNALSSFIKMKDGINSAANDEEKASEKLTEPMFFWALKDSLYIIGKQLAASVVGNQGNTSKYK